jgi:hypothetical protein
VATAVHRGRCVSSNSELALLDLWYPSRARRETRVSTALLKPPKVGLRVHNSRAVACISWQAPVSCEVVHRPSRPTASAADPGFDRDRDGRTGGWLLERSENAPRPAGQFGSAFSTRGTSTLWVSRRFSYCSGLAAFHDVASLKALPYLERYLNPHHVRTAAFPWNVTEPGPL